MALEPEAQAVTAGMADGDHARSHIGDHHGYKQGRYPAGATADQLGMLCFKGTDSADAGAKRNTKPFRDHRAADAAVLHSLLSGCHSKLGVTIGAQSIIVLHIFFRVKISDFRGQFCFKRSSVEKGNGS